jgi:hypothetical protein
MRIQPLVNVCKPVKNWQKYFRVFLNSSPPDSDFPYPKADIALTTSTDDILFTSTITTSDSQVTFRDPDLDYAKAFSDHRVSQNNWTRRSLSIGWKDAFVILSHISPMATKRLCLETGLKSEAEASRLFGVCRASILSKHFIQLTFSDREWAIRSPSAKEHSRSRP